MMMKLLYFLIAAHTVFVQGNRDDRKPAFNPSGPPSSLRSNFDANEYNAYNTMYFAFYEFRILTNAAGIDPAESGSDPAFSGSDNKNTF